MEQKDYKLKINGGTLSGRAFVPGNDRFENSIALYTRQKEIGIKKRPDRLSLGHFFAKFWKNRDGCRKDIIDKPGGQLETWWMEAGGKGVEGVKGSHTRSL